MGFLMTTVEQASFTASTTLSKDLRVCWCKTQELGYRQREADKRHRYHAYESQKLEREAVIQQN